MRTLVWIVGTCRVWGDENCVAYRRARLELEADRIGYQLRLDSLLLREQDQRVNRAVRNIHPGAPMGEFIPDHYGTYYRAYVDAAALWFVSISCIALTVCCCVWTLPGTTLSMARYCAGRCSARSNHLELCSGVLAYFVSFGFVTVLLGSSPRQSG